MRVAFAPPTDPRSPSHGRPAIPEMRTTRSGHHRQRPRLRLRSGTETALAMVAAAGVSAALQFLAGRLHVPTPSNVPTMLLGCAALVLVSVLVAVAVLGHGARSHATTVVVAGLLSAVTTVALALPLQGTRLYLDGLERDQQFRTQLLERLISSPTLADKSYSGLPSYYPVGWFWIGGRLGALLGLPGWQFYKPYAIATMALTAAAVFVLWTRVVPPGRAVAAALATAMVGLRWGASEPYSWILAATLPPICVLAWRAFTSKPTYAADEEVSHGDRSTLVRLGVYIGVCSAVYTLYLGFTLLIITIVAAASIWQRRLPATSVARQLAIVGFVAAPLAALVWLPYLWAWLHSDHPAGAAQRYLPAGGLPFPMLEASLLGLLCLVGMVWMIARIGNCDVAAALAIVTAATYLWFLLSAAALAADQTLLAFRLTPGLYTACATAGAFGSMEAARWGCAQLGSAPRRKALIGAAALTIAATVSIVQSAPSEWDRSSASLKRAYASYYPTGTTATGSADLADDGSWNAAIHAAISDLTHRPDTELILLTTDSAILPLWPYHSFQDISPQYANPLGDFTARNRLVTAWATATSAAQLAHNLDSSTYPPPTVFVLRRDRARLVMTLTSDTFPLSANVRATDVTFARAAFTGPPFALRDVGPFTVAVRL
jgi:galactan 5-O-arabinofuranosyltransferase